jgi:hypothetical protein
MMLAVPTLSHCLLKSNMSAFAEHLIKIKSRNECSSCYLSSAADEYIKREIVM